MKKWEGSKEKVTLNRFNEQNYRTNAKKWLKWYFSYFFLVQQWFQRPAEVPNGIGWVYLILLHCPIFVL
jgi:hypothetical protein